MRVDALELGVRRVQDPNESGASPDQDFGNLLELIPESQEEVRLV